MQLLHLSKENLWVFLTDFITGTPSIQPQMLSRKASTKKAPTTDSSTSPLSAIFPAYSSTDYGYWTGKEIQFIMFIYKFLCLCTFHVYSLSPQDIINIHLLHYSIFVNMLGFKQCSFKRMNNLLKPYLMIHKPKQNSILKFCIVRRYRNYNCENDAIFYYRHIFIQNYSSFLRAISKQMLLKPRQKHS